MFLMSESHPSLVNTAHTVETVQPDPSELHPLLASRWSPRAFDPLAEVTPAEVVSLLDAARWAPSYDNSQPWRFVVGQRDDETYKRIFTNLSEDNQRWAGRAALLLVGAYDMDGPAGYGAYDLGQAIAHLSMQASALGLYVHQMGDFDAVSLHADLELPDSVVARVAVAVGQLGNPATLPEDLRDLEVGLRDRRPIAELLLG
jgi:nitroreductase